jgi:hypothetical protein
VELACAVLEILAALVLEPGARRLLSTSGCELCDEEPVLRMFGMSRRHLP